MCVFICAVSVGVCVCECVCICVLLCRWPVSLALVIAFLQVSSHRSVSMVPWGYGWSSRDI